jgi:hypothetical protein
VHRWKASEWRETIEEVSTKIFDILLIIRSGFIALWVIAKHEIDQYCEKSWRSRASLWNLLVLMGVGWRFEVWIDGYVVEFEWNLEKIVTMQVLEPWYELV